MGYFESVDFENFISYNFIEFYVYIRIIWRSSSIRGYICPTSQVLDMQELIFFSIPEVCIIWLMTAHCSATFASGFRTSRWSSTDFAQAEAVRLMFLTSSSYGCLYCVFSTSRGTCSRFFFKVERSLERQLSSSSILVKHTSPPAPSEHGCS